MEAKELEPPNFDGVVFQTGPAGPRAAARKPAVKSTGATIPGGQEWKPYYPDARPDPCASKGLQLGCEYGSTASRKPQFGPEIMKKPYQ